ncbi:chaplin family protein [Actinomadura sp. 9N407]|uniref:chaplin family protein n=1 Tax=Actinomadura sp. 9N407 TaxID=3375154 RepID=UPI00378C17FE
MLKKLAATGVLTFAVSGAIMAAAGAASADAYTTNDNSAVSGNQVIAPVSVPVTACGNNVQVIAVLSDSGAGCEGNATVYPRHHGKGHHS